MAKTVVGMFRELDTAQRVIRELQNEGFRRDDISLMASDVQGEYGRSLGQMDTSGERAAKGAASGAGIGAVLGGLGGLLVGLGALVIPGVGPIIAAGPLAAALAGAGVGAATGGLAGALIEAGIPDEEARLYERGFQQGNVLVLVNAQDRMAEQASRIMNRFDPIDIDRHDWGASTTSEAGMAQRTTGMAGTTSMSGAGDFDTFDPEFRRHYDASYAGSGHDYSHFRPAYRYGYDLSHNQRYANRDWRDFEMDVRRDWERSHPESAWEEVKEAVREGWNAIRGRGTTPTRR